MVKDQERTSFVTQQLFNYLIHVVLFLRSPNTVFHEDLRDTEVEPAVDVYAGALLRPLHNVVDKLLHPGRLAHLLIPNH